MDTENSLSKDLIRYQFKVAERWFERGQSSSDKFAKFFFYFSGFNALYFLWGIIGKKSHEREYKIIEYFLRRFGSRKAEEILKILYENAIYFMNRGPIQSMRERNSENPLEGSPKYGEVWKKILKEGTNSVDRLVALGEILYLVRSNLVHGSKTQSGDDEVLIDKSILPLEVLLKESILMTKNSYPWI